MSWDIDPKWEATLGLGGTIAAVALFIAPIKTFQRIVANRNTEEFPSFPYISTFLNCAVWTFYCLPSITPNRFSPLITNVIGLAFQSVYLVLFLTYAKDKALDLVRRQLAILGAFLVLLVGLVLGVLPPAHRSPVVGFVATVFTVVMFAAPLSSLAVVLRTRSVEFMPLPLSLMGFACSSVWTVYGIYVRDAFVIVPNVLGMILGIVQLAIYFYISNESSKKGGYQMAGKGNGGDHGEEGIMLTDAARASSKNHV